MTIEKHKKEKKVKNWNSGKMCKKQIEKLDSQETDTKFSILEEQIKKKQENRNPTSWLKTHTHRYICTQWQQTIVLYCFPKTTQPTQSVNQKTLVAGERTWTKKNKKKKFRLS